MTGKNSSKTLKVRYDMPHSLIASKNSSILSFLDGQGFQPTHYKAEYSLSTQIMNATFHFYNNPGKDLVELVESELIDKLGIKKEDIKFS